jgi:hypothetical protein
MASRALVRLSPRHWAAGISPVLRGFSSTFLRPFAPGPLRPFLALMDAVTPTRSVVAVLGLFPAATPSAPREQVSLIHALGLPTIPSPTTGVRSVSPRHVTCRRIEPRPLPNGTLPYGNSGLRHSLAGSPRYAGRIEFLIVRTGRSPPVAPHPVSRRRSYLWLPSYVDSERTSTSPTKRAFRRTNGPGGRPHRAVFRCDPPESVALRRPHPGNRAASPSAKRQKSHGSF